MPAKRGFALLTPEERQAMASQGGRAAHAAGTAHEYTTAEAKEAGRKAGVARRARARTRRKNDAA